VYQVRLAVFEGPLDLLLHLIEQQQVDIWQVSMAQVAEQYLEFLSQVPAVELEEAGEYLVMAALLVRIKARHLLPERKEQDEPEEDEAALEAALLARVAEYRRYKEAAARLEQLAAANARLFRRPPVLPAPNPAPAGPPPGLTAETLARAFAAVLGRPLRRLADPSNVGVRGAVLLAGRALGWYDTWEPSPGFFPVERNFEPEPALVQLYEIAYGEWVRCNPYLMPEARQRG